VIRAAGQAVYIVHRRDLAGASDREGMRDELADGYRERHLRADRAAASGYVDEVIEPAHTRSRLAWALGALRRR
jgi:acetyl-CoA carboxylase carboxyltransferase component